MLELPNRHGETEVFAAICAQSPPSPATIVLGLLGSSPAAVCTSLSLTQEMGSLHLTLSHSRSGLCWIPPMITKNLILRDHLLIFRIPNLEFE